MKITETREIKAVFHLYLLGYSFKEIHRMLNAVTIQKPNAPIEAACAGEPPLDPERETNIEGNKEEE